MVRAAYATSVALLGVGDVWVPHGELCAGDEDAARERDHGCVPALRPVLLAQSRRQLDVVTWGFTRLEPLCGNSATAASFSWRSRDGAVIERREQEVSAFPGRPGTR